MFVTAVAILHVLAAAGWTGAMGYSLLVVQPRAAAFFGADDETYEALVATLAARQRWPVLAALSTVGGTGLILSIGTGGPHSLAWRIAVVTQTICWTAAAGLFAHVSWHLWPRRVFAVAAERAALRRRFRRAGLTLLMLAVVATSAGVVASRCRT